MSIAQRAAAKAIYQRWFYAPHWTGRRCARRLLALGFVWVGAHWRRPTAARFLEGLKQ